MMRHYNHNQKVFELGSCSATKAVTWGCAGVVTWGLGGLLPLSYRTLFSRLADTVTETPPTTIEEVMNRWIDLFWPAYSAFLALPHNKPLVDQCRALATKQRFVPGATAAPDMRSPSEEAWFQQVASTYTAGFCIGGYALPDRVPTAYHVSFRPQEPSRPSATKMGDMAYEFWGASNIFQRLIRGMDEQTKDSIMNSGKWGGTRDELNTIILPHSLGHLPGIPIRDALDFVYMCLYSTIKTIKFSQLPPTCGGPIELAVMRTDRPFEWVRHKPWDTAVAEGGLT
jgi:hypothetical protein